ncbi:tyrosine-protein phosphatase [Speluncibacter jeojiensis]|uniref:Tyrosine-protein phosphatase n=1 Tax=Speluncibacter jeojiensis TaxID=2710754 RepID=A0A9X4M318_9ACTN|nr:tyrosine-protein phosphatase [Rhodococcus sp. D2-41]MDG3015917.1 tyrosine-protein phosphatase [Corynebacteriales bacterium D3-21]
MSALPTDPIRTAALPRLASVANFRDVAAADGTTAAGRALRRGVFYRSNALTPDTADLATLASLGLTAVYDVRTDAEVAQTPDVLLPSAAYVRIPILSGNLVDMTSGLASPDDARAFMRGLNRSFVTDAGNRAGFERLLTALAGTEGPQVFHCTAGKDRTGWASMLLLSIAGASDETIMTDYLATNDSPSSWTAATYELIKSRNGEAVAEVFAPMLGVDESYLRAGLGQLEQTYGTVEDYLTSGLGLAPETIATLEAKLAC